MAAVQYSCSVCLRLAHLVTLRRFIKELAVVDALASSYGRVSHQRLGQLLDLTRVLAWEEHPQRGFEVALVVVVVVVADAANTVYESVK